MEVGRTGGHYTNVSYGEVANPEQGIKATGDGILEDRFAEPLGTTYGGAAILSLNDERIIKLIKKDKVPEGWVRGSMAGFVKIRPVDDDRKEIDISLFKDLSEHNPKDFCMYTGHNYEGPSPITKPMADAQYVNVIFEKDGSKYVSINSLNIEKEPYFCNTAFTLQTSGVSGTFDKDGNLIKETVKENYFEEHPMYYS